MLSRFERKDKALISYEDKKLLNKAKTGQDDFLANIRVANDELMDLEEEVQYLAKLKRARRRNEVLPHEQEVQQSED